MTPEQLLSDQSYIFQDLPTETIVIGQDAFPCIVLSARENNQWEPGGLSDMPGLTVAIERINLTTMPKQGDQASFRLQAYSVATVIHDHDTSPVRIELESLVGRK